MKHYIATILCAISILSFTGSTFGDGQVDCAITPDEANNLNFNDIMLDRLHECFGKAGGLDLQNVREVFVYGTTNIFKVNCKRNSDSINRCISETSARFGSCHNESQHKVLGFLEEMLKTALRYVCAENGEYFPLVMYRVFSEVNSTVERNFLTDCFATAKTTVVHGNNSEMLGFYREVKEFKHCLVNKVRGFNKVVFETEFMLNGILRSMKCFHPETGTTVLCETLDSSASIIENVMCPFVSENANQSIDSEIFLNLASQCVPKNLNQLNFEKLKLFTRIDEYKTFFNIYCQNRHVIKNCLGDVSSNSKVCQNQTEDQFLDVLKEFFEHLLESGCKQDGDTFASVISGLLNSAEGAVLNGTMTACFDEASESFSLGGFKDTSDGDAYPSITMLAYSVLNMFKQCILEGASDLGSFKSVFDSFTNDLFRAQKCIHPETRAIVLCETLVNNIQPAK